MFPAVPPATPPSGEERAPASPLWGGGGADRAARRLFEDLARQEACEVAAAAAREGEGGSQKGTEGKNGSYSCGARWTELDAAAERAHLADPLPGYAAQFSVEREEADFADVNGAWLESRLRSVAARAKLAESRMIRQLTKQLSA